MEPVWRKLPTNTKSGAGYSGSNTGIKYKYGIHPAILANIPTTGERQLDRQHSLHNEDLQANGFLSSKSRLDLPVVVGQENLPSQALDEMESLDGLSSAAELQAQQSEGVELELLLDSFLQEEDKLNLSYQLNQYQTNQCDLSELLTNLLHHFLAKLSNPLTKYKLLSYIRRVYVSKKEERTSSNQIANGNELQDKHQLDLRLFDAMTQRYLLASNALMQLPVSEQHNWWLRPPNGTRTSSFLGETASSPGGMKTNYCNQTDLLFSSSSLSFEQQDNNSNQTTTNLMQDNTNRFSSASLNGCPNSANPNQNRLLQPEAGEPVVRYEANYQDVAPTFAYNSNATLMKPTYQRRQQQQQQQEPLWANCRLANSAYCLECSWPTTPPYASLNQMVKGNCEEDAENDAEVSRWQAHFRSTRCATVSSDPLYARTRSVSVTANEEDGQLLHSYSNSLQAAPSFTRPTNNGGSFMVTDYGQQEQLHQASPRIPHDFLTYQVGEDELLAQATSRLEPSPTTTTLHQTSYVSSSANRQTGCRRPGCSCLECGLCVGPAPTIPTVVSLPSPPQSELWPHVNLARLPRAPSSCVIDSNNNCYRFHNNANNHRCCSSMSDPRAGHLPPVDYSCQFPRKDGHSDSFHMARVQAAWTGQQTGRQALPMSSQQPDRAYSLPASPLAHQRQDIWPQQSAWQQQYQPAVRPVEESERRSGRHRSRQRMGNQRHHHFGQSDDCGPAGRRRSIEPLQLQKHQQKLPQQRAQTADSEPETECNELSLIPSQAKGRLSASVAEQMKELASNFVQHYGDGAKGPSSYSSSGHRKPHLQVRRTLRVKIKKSKPILGIAIEGGFNVSGQLIPRIVCVHEDGAAYQCGKLRASDLILEVNGTSTVNMNHDEIAKTIATAYYQDPRSYIEFLVGESIPV